MPVHETESRHVPNPVYPIVFADASAAFHGWITLSFQDTMRRRQTETQVTLMLTPEWGPYADQNEARTCLTRFVDRACGPDTGIVWTANGNLYPFRAPKRDGEGIGAVSIFEWNKPPPPPKPPSGFLGKVKTFIRDALEAQGKAALQESQASLAMSQAMGNVLNRMFTAHKDDGVGVALDILCIALSVALLPTGLGVLGAVGLVGGVILLGADGGAYAMELGGEDERAENFKKQTERFRIVATVMTLPDVAYGGVKLVKELVEIRELRAMDRITAQAATNMSARTTNAARAERLHQIAARANLRAQVRTEQISAALRLEATGKAAGAGSVGLLVREEIQTDKSLLHQFFSYLQVHCTAVHA